MFPHDLGSFTQTHTGVRTDEHAVQLRAKADFLDKQAAHTPQPVGDRLRVNAGNLRSFADEHDRTRITREEMSA
ncbi:hypothetical protein ACGFX8_12740 [Streptomyces sp. NPDC048362]|uniref:hypothetical protein n=1 Tax=Streptomyces sp. NPDC048362 TaxID=3365539 RepID=UPI00371236AA